MPLGEFGSLDVDIGKGLFSREDRTGYSDIGSGDGAGDGLEGGLSFESGYIGVLQDRNWVGLDVRYKVMTEVNDSRRRT